MAHQYTTMVLGWIDVVNNVQLCRCSANGMRPWSDVVVLSGMISSCSVDKFKSQLDKHLRNISDLPCQPGYNNSLDGGDCLNGGHYADALTAN